jgi:RNA polymerase sigma-70 factor (ECF subfamily)
LTAATSLVSRIGRSADVRDSALESAFAQRREWAYEAAYSRFGGRLYATALRLLRNPQAAQDCVHDVLLRLWRKPNAYSPERGILEAFLVVCVRNESLARLRGDARHAQIQQSVASEPESYDLVVDPIERARIETAMQRLSALQRRVVQLAYYGGMTHREIAEQLDEPVGTVKSRLSAALRSLRDALGSSGAAYGG